MQLQIHFVSWQQCLNFPNAAENYFQTEIFYLLWRLFSGSFSFHRLARTLTIVLYTFDSYCCITVLSSILSVESLRNWLSIKSIKIIDQGTGLYFKAIDLFYSAAEIVQGIDSVWSTGFDTENYFNWFTILCYWYCIVPDLYTKRPCW